MESTSNVIVIGGGPSGSFAAFHLAKKHVNVAVFEEHKEIGFPVHCVGHLSLKGLKRIGLYPLPSKVVENTFYGAVFHSAKGSNFSIRFPQPVTCAVNRALFDKFVAENAERAGARYRMGAKVESLVIENSFVKGIVVKNDMGDVEEIPAKIVVDAEGVSSRILRLAGLTSLNRNAVVNGVQAEVEDADGMDANMVEVFLDKEFASGFYAWLVPKRDGTAKVGLAAKTGNPKELLKKFMLKNPAASQKLRNARIRQIAFHPLTLGGPIMQNYSDGFLAVGDAASQVKPTTGGGVIFGMTCARIAAEVAHEALVRSDFSSDFLSEYQKRCREVLGFDMNVMLRLRRIFDGISDEKIDSIISFFNRIRLGETLQYFDDIDSQGRSLLRLLRRPKMMAALFYFFSTFLSTNP